jgi:phenylalanyl-tRNA synthetase beta chain
VKVLVSWLREFAPDLPEDVERLTEALDDLGTPVEERAHLGEGLEGVVVARVLETRPHPQADKIQLVDVDAGDGEALQICCGAFNMVAGDLVPLATLGTTMPGGLRIERRKLRGEWSNGMLCSATELGLGDDAEGILVLSPTLEPGRPLTEALGLAGDWLLDLEVNANRPDALSVAGVARDVAARFGVGFALPEVTSPAGGAPSTEVAAVEIVDPGACPRFLARVLRDVEIGPSPAWLANRITQLGMRPISNVVDISNYVMLELGHPNHAYDLDTVAGGRLRVRYAREGETLVTLDDVERRFLVSDVLICDGGDVPIGVAGVMGGAATEISDATTDVLLEAAWWHPMQIARTSTRLNLRSEASRRFERGTDLWGLDRAVERFCALLAEAGAVPAPGTIDARGHLPERAPIRVRTSRVNAVTGLDLDAPTIRRLLEPIGFLVADEDDDGAQVIDAPSFRPDVVEEVDVIEEVARHHGYARLPKTVPTSPHTGGLSHRQKERRRIRATLVGLGLDEALPMPFLAPDDLARTGLDPDGITVTNPLDARESVLRTSLRPGLLRAVAYNASHRNEEVGLFELGKVFLPPLSGQERPPEPEHLGVIRAGREAPDAVAVWNALADRLALPGPGLRAAALPGLHPTRGAVVTAGDRDVGAVGEIDPAVAEAWGITGRVAWLELDLDVVDALVRRERRYRTVSRYPSNDIDLAFVVDDQVPAAAVEATVAGAAGDLLASLRLFDVFRGGSLPDGTRSLAYALRLQATDRTLTDAEVAQVRQAVIDAASSAHGALLRG